MDKTKVTKDFDNATLVVERTFNVSVCGMPTQMPTSLQSGGDPKAGKQLLRNLTLYLAAKITTA